MAEDHPELSEEQGSAPRFARAQKETINQQDLYIPSGIQFILGIISSVSLLFGGGWLRVTMGDGENSALLYLLVATGTLLPVVLSGKRRGFWIGFGVGFLLSSGLIALIIYLFLTSHQ